MSASERESPIAAANKLRIARLQEFEQTDAGNAEAFELLHGDRFRYNHTNGKWLIWNGRYWAEDRLGGASRATLQTSRERLSAAALIPHADDKRKGVEWALRTESVHGRRAMLISAQTIKSLATTTEDYDQDLFKLTVGNGTLDLRSGKLHESNSNDLITRATEIPFIATAVAPRWAQFLDEVFGGNIQMIEYVQRAVGYSLTGDTREQCFFLLCGAGANGKTTFLETVMRLPGTNATTAAFSAFLAQSNQGGPRNDLASLCGSRFVKAAEAEHQARLDEAVMKVLTGEDTISARFLYHEEFSYKPQFKIWLATNHKPAIWERTDAIWRRIKLIEFNRQFTGAQADMALRSKLGNELPGVLAWAVKGCLEWQQRGLDEPKQITLATQEYRHESDEVGRFLADRCHLERSARSPAKQLHEDYVAWCAEHHEKPLATNQFAAKLAERGFEKKRKGSGVIYLGVELLPAVALVTTTLAEPKVKRRRK